MCAAAPRIKTLRSRAEKVHSRSTVPVPEIVMEADLFGTITDEKEELL
jgi:hypothetical protein